MLGALPDGSVVLRTNPRGSPTGYPFNVVQLSGDAERAASRRRVCDLGYLRVPIRTSEGRTVYRCSAEPVDAFVAKGGDVADTEGRRCLCNGLTANIGQAQQRPETNSEEIPLVTSGDDLLTLETFSATRPGYTATEVIRYLCT